MKKEIILSVISIIISAYNCKSQSCSIFELSNTNKVYLYPIAKGASLSKVNDSISYSLEKLSENKFRVQKLLFDKVIENNDYEYKGKNRYQIFKVRNRKGDKVSIEKKKVKICILE
jgi:hypothetical protein